ncbi:MAG TPA: DegT/DnrJ/EryC1/StrS family aminotransferase [Candidatus Brocadiia bacterium]|nr:DegT/DnrJ/EryC1/StrS family aminotransferase [Candidatus Brocadiia bacterium]
MAHPVLAIDGGPKTVTEPMNDSWRIVTELERSHVNAVLDDPGRAYEELDKFEAEFAECVGARHAVSMCNGTATLHCAIFAAGARRGAEVIVPSVTWHASISPILHCGATPVFCEADPRTFCADPADVRRRVTDRTAAIVVTHVYGNPADMDSFREIVDGTKIKLIEDASHAHGATWDGRKVGAVGDIGCFSLQASKPVTGFECGVAATNDDELFEKMLVLGQYGRIEKLRKSAQFADLHNIGLGVKYRANPLAMAMARAQLKRLDDQNAKRAKWFARLDELLGGIRGVYPQKTYPKAVRGGLLLYTGTLDPDEIGAPVDALLKALVAEGVSTTPRITPYGYGVMHLEPIFTDFDFGRIGGGPWADFGPGVRQPLRRGDLPVSEKIHDTCFWLTTPVDPSPRWVEQVGEAFGKVVANAGRLSRA